MRALRALLLTIGLLLGQIGFGRLTFVMANGDLCPTCPTLADYVARQARQVGGSETRIQSSHYDCHDCCTLTGHIDQPSDSEQGFHAPGGDLVAVLPTAAALPVSTARWHRQAIGERVDENPPTGPPDSYGSRAPPASTLGV